MKESGKEERSVCRPGRDCVNCTHNPALNCWANFIQPSAPAADAVDAFDQAATLGGNIAWQSAVLMVQSFQSEVQLAIQFS